MLFFMLQIVKGVKLYNAAIAAVSAEQQSESGGDSYCCLDYAQVMAVGYLEPYLTSSFCAFLFIVSLTHAPDVNFFHPNNVDGQIGDKVCILRSGRSSYVSLLFAPVYNILWYRIQFVKQKIKDQLEHDNTTQEYTCPKTSFDHRYLHSPPSVNSVHLLSNALFSFLFFAQI